MATSRGEYIDQISIDATGSRHELHDARISGIDTTPTSGSANLVTSGGVYTTLADKANDSGVVHVTGDEDISGNKTFYDDVIVSNMGEDTAGEATIELQASSSSIAAHKYYSAETAEDFSWVNWSGTYSPWPPGPGAEPVTHTKTLQQALDERNNPSVDSNPTSGSTNAVSSGGVYTALSGKEDTTNKVTSLSSSSTDTQYPSAKCVYDLVGDIETLINAL